MPDTTPLVEHIKDSIVPQATAGTVQDTIVGEAPRACTVTGASITLTAAVALNAANYRIWTLVNTGQAGTASVSVATLDTSATAFVAQDERAMVLSGTAANLILVDGDILELRETVAGTGVAHAGGIVDVTVSRN